MALTSAHRIEANVLKRQYELVLRIMQQKTGTTLPRLLEEIKKETGRSVELEVRFAFTDEPDDKYPAHDSVFLSYDVELQTAIHKNSGMREHANWDFRLRDFKKARADFVMCAVLVESTEPTILPETAMVSTLKTSQEINSNDRRFLRSLRIKVDED